MFDLCYNIILWKEIELYKALLIDKKYADANFVYDFISGLCKTSFILAQTKQFNERYKNDVGLFLLELGLRLGSKPIPDYVY